MKLDSIILIVLGLVSLVFGILNIDRTLWGGAKYDGLKDNKTYRRIINIVLGLIILLVGIGIRKK